MLEESELNENGLFFLFLCTDSLALYGCHRSGLFSGLLPGNHRPALCLLHLHPYLSPYWLSDLFYKGKGM